MYLLFDASGVPPYGRVCVLAGGSCVSEVGVYCGGELDSPRMHAVCPSPAAERQWSNWYCYSGPAMHSSKLWHRHTPTSAYAIWCATVEPAKAIITHRLVAIVHSSGVKPSWWVMDCGHRRQRNREVRVQDPDRQLVGGGRFGRWQTASQIATWQLRKKLRFLSLPCTLSTMIIGSRRCV